MGYQEAAPELVGEDLQTDLAGLKMALEMHPCRDCRWFALAGHMWPAGIGKYGGIFHLHTRGAFCYISPREPRHITERPVACAVFREREEASDAADGD